MQKNHNNMCRYGRCGCIYPIPKPQVQGRRTWPKIEPNNAGIQFRKEHQCLSKEMILRLRRQGYATKSIRFLLKETI